MAYRYFPSEFSSYEDYVKYLKEKGFAIEVTEEKALDSLSTAKEMDVKKEFDRYCKDLYATDIQEAPFTKMYDCAKHFFELGLKARKEA